MRERRTGKAPIVIGLTGSIGMGKSTVAGLLQKRGAAVFDADAIVHGLIGRGGGGIKKIAKAFPEALKRGTVDRETLGRLVFSSPDKLKRLEKILHPLVEKEERRFLKQEQQKKTPAVVLDVPLLFETGTDRRCDVTVCVTASRSVQKDRVFRRSGMTPGRLKAIENRQWPDREKRKRADWVINTTKGYADTRKQIEHFWKSLTKE